MLPGATVVVRMGADILFEGKFGFRSIVPDRQPMRLDTVFDLSSLTKPLATTIAMMMLVREGKVRLDDRVTRFFHNYGVHGKTYTTFRHLLAHCSGLPAWRPYYQQVAEVEKNGKVNFMASRGAKELRLRPDPSRAARVSAREQNGLLRSELHPAGRNRRANKRDRTQQILPRPDFPSARSPCNRFRRSLDGAFAPPGNGYRDVCGNRDVPVAQTYPGRRSARRQRLRDGRRGGSRRPVRPGQGSRPHREPSCLPAITAAQTSSRRRC